jgi:multisubunit Na+/H+ antiporter MnhG subunit
MKISSVVFVVNNVNKLSFAVSLALLLIFKNLNAPLATHSIMHG